MSLTETSSREWLERLPGCDPAALARLDELVGLLRNENARQNLVAASSLSQVWQRHIIDSAQLLQYVPRGTATWLDLGTGAGFPGLVIAVLRPDCHLTLVEARSRRAQWLKHASAALRLTNVTIANSRLEVITSFSAAVISARAFAPLSRLLDLSARFSTSDTIWVLPKGRSAREELHGLRGWNHTFHVEQSLTDDEAGIITGRLIGPNTATEERSDDLRSYCQSKGRSG